MPACATAIYVAYTMRARADMDAVQCLLTLASGHALRSVHMQINEVQCVQMWMLLETHAQ